MRQEALCYQRLPLLRATSRSTFRSLVLALRAQSGLLLIIPCTHINKDAQSVRRHLVDHVWIPVLKGYCLMQFYMLMSVLIN